MGTPQQLGIGLQVSDVSGQKLHNVSNVPPPGPTSGNAGALTQKLFAGAAAIIRR